MDKTNVLFVSHVSSKKYGGAERVLENIIKGLDAGKFNTVLMMPRKDGEDESICDDCSSKITYEEFEFIPLNNTSKIFLLILLLWRVFSALVFIPRILKKHNIDVVCANSIIAAAIIALPTKLSGKRLIYYEHNIPSQRKGHIIGYALKPVALMSNTIICISKAVKNGLLNESVPEKKLVLIYNGCDFSALENNNESKKSNNRIKSDNSIKIGMVANFIPWKRHLVFLELIKKIADELDGTDIHGIIVGGCMPGNEGYYHEVSEWVERYNGEANIELVGFQTDVASYFKKFDVLINPALAEPFGLIFIEAMYFNCLVVGSDQGAAPEIIQQGITGLTINFDDPDSVFKLIHIIKNPELMKFISDNARKTAKEKYALSHQIKLFEAVLLND